MRTLRIRRWLHGLGVHRFCRTYREGIPLAGAGYIHPDGSVWYPDLDGIMSTREVHW